MLLTVYTRETFYYEEDIVVCVMQDRFDENICRMCCRRKGHIVFSIILDSSIYSLDGVEAIIAMQFQMYGVSAKLITSVKRFTYVLQPAMKFHYIDFEVSGNKDCCFIRFYRDESAHSKTCYMQVNYDDIKLLRYNIDCLFWSLFNNALYRV